MALQAHTVEILEAAIFVEGLIKYSQGSWVNGEIILELG